MKIYDDFIDAFKKAVAEHGNLNQFAEHTGLAYGTLHRWYNGKQIPSLRAIEPLLPYIDWAPSHGQNCNNIAAITQERDELLKKCQEQEKRIGELEAEIRGMKTAMEYMRPQPDSLSTAAEGRKAG